MSSIGAVPGYQQLVAGAQVVMIDVALAGDNALVVGVAASRVAIENRAQVIFWGIAAAVLLRLLFAAVAVQLLAVVGLRLAGGLLLLWVCWKMFRELRDRRPNESISTTASPEPPAATSLWSAIGRIIAADLSMSLDNALAVGGAAKGSFWVLAAGLGLSVVLMGVAATFIANLLMRHPWIAWLGLAVILYVAIDMIWRDAVQLGSHAGRFYPAVISAG